MAVVNVNNLLNGKDSRWLQLEVCREFQRNKCTRPDTECKFAHPPTNVEVQNGRVTACYDSIKGRCNRDKPPCKYFHPPQHLKDQLLINGRNHLALKNALLQQMGLAPGQPMIPSQMPTVDVTGKLQFPGSSAATAAATALALGQPSLGFMTAPYLPGVPQVGNTFSPYFSAAPIMPTTAAILGPDPNNPLSMAVQQTVVTQQKMPRTDRLEPTTAAGLAALTAAAEIGRKRPLDATNDDFLMAFPGMMPYKRAAGDKSGIPVYQQSAAAAAAYQQLLQPFVPVSCEYRLPTSTSTAATSAFPSAATAAAFPTTGASIAAAAGAFPTSAANAAAAAAAAAAFTGIALNKQPSTAATGTAPTAGLAATPRFQTLNPATAAALTQHFLPTLAAFRPQFSTVAPSVSFSATTPTVSSHFSDLFAAAQLASLASGAGNLMAHSSAGNVLSSGAGSLYAGNTSLNGSTSSHNINNVNNSSINNNNNSSSNNNNNEDDLQPFKKMKTS